MAEATKTIRGPVRLAIGIGRNPEGRPVVLLMARAIRDESVGIEIAFTAEEAAGFVRGLLEAMRQLGSLDQPIDTN